MSDTPERKRPRAPVSKKRRAPVPARKKRSGEASGPPAATPEEGAPDAAAQQAAAQKTAAQKAAAEQAAAQQAAARKAAAQQAALQKAAAQKAAAQKAAAQKAAAQQAALQKAAAQKAAAQKAAAQKAAAQKAAAQKAAAQQAPAQEGAAQQAAAQQAAAQRAAAQKAAAQRAAAQKAAGAPAAATPKRPSAPKPGAPRRAAAPRPGAGRAPARAPGRPGRAAAASPDGDAEEPPTFVHAPKGASKIPLIGGVIAVVVVVVLAVVVLGGGKDPVVDPSVADSGPVEPQVDPRIQESQDALERALAHQRSEPTDFEGIVEHFEYVTQNFAGLPAAKEAGDARAAVLDSWRTAVEEARRALEQKVTDHRIAHEYSAAISALDSPPEVFSGASSYFGDENPVFRWMEQQRRDLRVTANAYERLKELEEKAARYAEHEDIATAILTVGFPDKYEEDAPTVWALQQETIASIERDGLQRWLEKERGAEAARAEAELLAKEEADRQRKERWQSLKGSVEWVPHLGRHNLYNWIANSDRLRQDPLWRLIDREGVGVLIGDNSSGSDMYMGPFSNHWIDYVLEFDVKVRGGKLQLSPRTQLTQVRGFSAVGDQTSPMFQFSEESGFPLDQWVTVHVEVNGDSMVANFEGAPEPIVLDPETTRSPETGGFLFWVEDGSRVEIRNVRSKLVNSSRDGPF